MTEINDSDLTPDAPKKTHPTGWLYWSSGVLLLALAALLSVRSCEKTSPDIIARNGSAALDATTCPAA
ncbi:MAG: hypothetical protein LBV18_04840 [Alistipes sp.]|jgi:hypothetical protein|nr:hypothetical protein [Alistipes sp.]